MMAEKQGLAGSTIAGIGAIVIGVVILLVVISTLDNAKLMQSTALTSVQQDNMCINTTGLTTACGLLNQFDGRNRDFSISLIVNDTGMGSASIANYTLMSTGRLKNSTKTYYNSVNVTYTYRAYTGFETSFADARDNFTIGIGNVSTKLPTILLLVAVTLLLGVIVLLVVKAREMSSFAGGVGGKSSVGAIGGEQGSL
jgi:hypothetical protein